MGFVLLFTMLVLAVVTGKMGNVNIPYKEIIVAIGERPSLSDFTSKEEFNLVNDEYSRRFEEESKAKLSILKAERKKEWEEIIMKLGIVDAIIAILVFTFYWRSTVKHFEIKGNVITFFYTSGKEKKIDIVRDKVNFERVRLFAIRYFYIPRLFYTFYYTSDKSLIEKDIIVFITKKEGEKIAEYFANFEY